MKTEFIAQLLAQPCYDILRTKHQLGYYVGSSLSKINGIQGIIIYVQSNKNIHFVEDKINKLIESMEEYISNLTDSEFSNHKMTIEFKHKELPINLYSLTNKFMGEIDSQQYNFNRSDTELPFLRKVSKNDILRFFKVRIIYFYIYFIISLI